MPFGANVFFCSIDLLNHASVIVFAGCAAMAARAEMRQTPGTAVFADVGVTVFGIFLTPIFYVVVRKFAKWPDPSLAKNAHRTRFRIQRRSRSGF